MDVPLSLWYLDDGSILAPRDLVHDLLPRLIEQFQTLGLELNTNKSVIWGPGNSNEYRASLQPNDCWLQIAMKEWQPEDGLDVLGVPITF